MVTDSMFTPYSVNKARCHTIWYNSAGNPEIKKNRYGHGTGATEAAVFVVGATWARATAVPVYPVIFSSEPTGGAPAIKSDTWIISGGLQSLTTRLPHHALLKLEIETKVTRGVLALLLQGRPHLIFGRKNGG